jgi:hypothetical protein
MDAKLNCPAASGVDELVKSIVGCRQTLIDVTQKRHKWARLSVTACDVYADPKVVDRLRSSDLWTDAPPLADNIDERTGDVRAAYTTRVADFELFQLHSHPIMGDDVRVVMDINAGIDNDLLLFGNVELVRTT